MSSFRAACLALAMVVLVLAGCDIWKGDGYTWYKAGPAAGDRDWVQIGQCRDGADATRECVRAVNAACPEYDAQGKRLPDWPNLGGCSTYGLDRGLCVVYARFTEAEARRRDIGGRTFFEHEAGKLKPDGKLDDDAGYGHCAGWRHKEQHPRGM